MAPVNIASVGASFDDYKDELLMYLARRFGSIEFAERVSRETRERVSEADILSVVGNPRVYLSSFALSLGLQILQEEFVAKRKLRFGSGVDESSLGAIVPHSSGSHVSNI